MPLEYQILAAVALDLVLGDPRWLPHPVRAIAAVAVGMERFTRWAFPKSPAGLKAAGIVTVAVTCAMAGLAAWAAIGLAGRWHPLAGDVVGILVIYTTIAGRDLARHSMEVCRPLERGDLPAARTAVGRIVGRDTADLDASGVVRAAVESVAESTVDGVTAPLFFALLAGPVGAMVYRTVNTLDSTFGYRNERYLHFGWAAARLDDLANYVPARVTAPLVALAAALMGQRPLNALQTLRRDGRKHASPNSGLTEAAMAGALGVQLGGTNFYQGEALEKPAIGRALTPLTPRTIRLANALMFAAAGLFLAIGLAVRMGAAHAWRAWIGGIA